MKTIRDQWCDREITDIDYIRHLEKENEGLKTKSSCEGCEYESAYDHHSECFECKRIAVDNFKQKGS